MGRKNNKQNLALPPFVPMTFNMLNSQAYKDLTFAARAMLPFFIGKPKKNIRDASYLQAEFTFSYKEAVSCGCSTRTFLRVIEDLMRKGFIDPVDKGGLRGCKLSNNIFRNSDRWKQYGKTGFVQVEWKMFGLNFKNGHCTMAKSTVERDDYA